MKKIGFRLILPALIILSALSCKKDYNGYKTPPIQRNIQFDLFTSQDFSTDNNKITFTLHIKNKNKTLWDSVLSSMKINEIPVQANKLTFNKIVPDDDGSELSAGFVYEIENVGMSWYLDTIKAGEAFKHISYDFH